MSLKSFKKVFNQILHETPLPYGDKWDIQPLQNANLEYDENWFEVLYRTTARYDCKHGHGWKSSWSMILFRFQLDDDEGFGRVRMKRFGQRCNKCPKDMNYLVGQCNFVEIWRTVQCLLLHILQRCYERRHEHDLDVIDYIIPVSDVPRGRFGGAPHPKEFCEGCAHNRCQDMYNTLTKKK